MGPKGDATMDTPNERPNDVDLPQKLQQILGNVSKTNSLVVRDGQWSHTEYGRQNILSQAVLSVLD